LLSPIACPSVLFLQPRLFFSPPPLFCLTCIHSLRDCHYPFVTLQSLQLHSEIPGSGLLHIPFFPLFYLATTPFSCRLTFRYTLDTAHISLPFPAPPSTHPQSSCGTSLFASVAAEFQWPFFFFFLSPYFPPVFLESAKRELDRPELPFPFKNGISYRFIYPFSCLVFLRNLIDLLNFLLSFFPCVQPTL